MSDTQHDLNKGKTRAHERLEVEDEDTRHRRMHGMLMQLDSQSIPRSREVPRSFDFGDRKTFFVEPPSALMSRVQAFLPQFAASTAEITRRAEEDPASVDIEKLGDEGRYIQMDLGLGVFEERKADSPADDHDAEMAHSETSATSSDTDPDSDSDTTSDDYDSDSSVDIISSTMSTFAYQRPIKPLPRRKSTRPQIVVLGEGSFSGSKDSGSPATSSSGDSQT